MRRRNVLLGAAFAPVAAISLKAGAQTAAPSTSRFTTYRTVDVDGLEIFYREAGPKGAPTVLLLHGFPSSSRMFDTLLPLLANQYHLVAPDYPGFGHSATPPRGDFPYTFSAIADVVDRFTQRLGLDRYVLYLQDYGGPVGFRLALAHPERVAGLVIQNAVSHEAGLAEKLWAPRRAFWADRAAHEEQVRAGLISPEATRLRHVSTSPHPERYSPDLWSDETAFLSRPGEAEIQSDLFYDYRTNVALYPTWQSWMRERRPPTLVVWGRYDPSFDIAEVAAIQRDLPDAEVHVLEAGHFALDEAVDDIAAFMRDFLPHAFAQ